MVRPLLLSLLLPAAVLSWAGCRSNREKRPAPEPVVLTPEESREAKPRYRKTKPPEWFGERIADIEDAWAEGRLREALEMVYEARGFGPAEEHARRLNELLRGLNRAVLEVETVRAWVEVVEDPITFGEPIRVRIHVENPGPRPVRIPAAGEGTSGSLFAIELERREYDVKAHVVTSRRVEYTPVLGDLEIPPSGSAVQPVTIRDLSNRRGLDGFRVYTIGGHLRPTVVEVGGLRRWERVALTPARLRSFRPNYEHLREDPLARIEQAIEKGAGVHLLTASALLPADQRTEAVDRLVAALRGDRPIDWAIFASLRYLTNVDLAREVEAWKAWWPRVRSTYFATPPEYDPDEPVFARD